MPPKLEGIESAREAEATLAAALRGRRLVFEVGIDAAFRGDVVNRFNKALESECRRQYGRAATQLPALLVTAVATDAVFAYTGGDLWGRTSLAHGTGTEIGQAFSTALKRLDLETFPVFDEQGAARYVSRILAHGGVPVYCLGDLFRLVLQARARGMIDALELIETLQDGGTLGLQIDRPVKRFLCSTGSVGRDFLQRVLELADEVDSGHSATALATRLGLPAFVITEFRRLSPTLERATASAHRVIRCTLTFDPATADAPELQVPCTGASEIRWVLLHEPAGDRPPIAGVSSPGDPASVPVSPAARWRVVGTDVDSGKDRVGSLAGVSDARPALVFDGESGDVIGDPRFSSSELVWVVAPCELSTGDGTLDMGAKSRLVAGDWSGWVAHEVRVNDGGVLQGRLELQEISLRIGREEVSEVRYSNLVAGVITADGWPVFDGAPQLAKLPWAAGDADRWQVVVNARGHSPRSFVPDGNLEAVNATLRQLVGPGLVPDLSLRLIGPVGASYRAAGAVVPGLRLEPHSEVVLPTENSSVAVEVAAPLRIDGGQSSRATLPFSGEMARLAFSVADEREQHVELSLRCPTVRWRLLAGSSVMAPFATQLVRGTFHPEGSRRATLVVEGPSAQAMSARVLDGDGKELILEPVSVTRDGLRRYDLSQSIESAIHSECLSICVDIRVGDKAFRVAELEESISISLRSLEYQGSSLAASLSYQVAQSRPVPGRAVQVICVDRPWAQPVILRLANTDASGEIDCGRLRPGRYRARIVLSDGDGEPRVPGTSRWLEFSIPWPAAHDDQDALAEDERELLVLAVVNREHHAPVLKDPSSAAPAAALLLGSDQCDMKAAGKLLSAVPVELGDWSSALDFAADHYGVTPTAAVRASVRLLARAPGRVPPATASRSPATRLIRIAGLLEELGSKAGLEPDLSKELMGIAPDEALPGAGVLGFSARPVPLSELRRALRSLRRLPVTPLSANGRAKGAIEVRCWGLSPEPAERQWVSLLANNYPLTHADLTLLPVEVARECARARQWLEEADFPDGSAVAKLHVWSFEAAAHLAQRSERRVIAGEFLASVAKSFPAYVETRLAYFYWEELGRRVRRNARGEAVKDGVTLRRQI